MIIYPISNVLLVLIYLLYFLILFSLLELSLLFTYYLIPSYYTSIYLLLIKNISISY